MVAHPRSAPISRIFMAMPLSMWRFRSIERNYCSNPLAKAQSTSNQRTGCLTGWIPPYLPFIPNRSRSRSRVMIQKSESCRSQSIYTAGCVQFVRSSTSGATRCSTSIVSLLEQTISVELSMFRLDVLVELTIFLSLRRALTTLQLEAGGGYLWVLCAMTTRHPHEHSGFQVTCRCRTCHEFNNGSCSQPSG